EFASGPGCRISEAAPVLLLCEEHFLSWRGFTKSRISVNIFVPNWVGKKPNTYSLLTCRDE
ncbi:MAG: hypothetical protein RR394_03445, partial [Oscillospiraceae bacterium]